MAVVSARKSRLFGQTDRILGRTAAAVAAAAGAGLVGGAQESQAAIVYSGVINLPVPVTTSGFYLNFVTGVNATSPGSVPGWDINPWSSSAFSIWANNASEASNGMVSGLGTVTTAVDNLPLGTLVDGSRSYVRTGAVQPVGNSFGFVLNSDDNYTGFRMTDETNGNAIYFGWARWHLGPALNDASRTLIEYAYDNSGAAITVGAVPEPGSLALLSIGAAGLVAYRRRQKKAKAAEPQAN